MLVVQFTWDTACSSISYACKNKIKRSHSNNHKKFKNFNWSHTWIRNIPIHHLWIKKAKKCWYYTTCIRFKLSYKTLSSTHHLKTGLQEQTAINCNNISHPFLTKSSQESSGRRWYGRAQQNKDWTAYIYLFTPPVLHAVLSRLFPTPITTNYTKM